MKLKRKKKATNRVLPLVAVGAGLVALAGAIAFLLGSRRRRQKAKGAVQEATAPVRHAGREYDDVTLARKVESEILRDAGASKGAVAVSAQHGVVELRGVVEDEEELKGLGEAAAKVSGVKDVTNLLHTPGTEPKHAPPSDPAEVRERAEQS
jgi:osmotically-inducible protein OsmY